MNKFKQVFAKLFWSENQKEIIIAPEKDVKFNVSLGNLLIGTLLYVDNMWHFWYSEDFKMQNNIAPLTNFPSKKKYYTTKNLWPFFASRIPSYSQQQIKDKTESEDVVTLLQKFGKKTITNPYELTLAT